jgi:hypothetical protein
MLCTACGRTDAPDSLVVGSDAVEAVLWALLLAPGLLYCWWRHVHRRRICQHCGSAALVRESRASRYRTLENRPVRHGAEEPPGRPGQLVYAARRIPWMATPSQRFRRVTRGGAAFAAAGMAFAVVSLNTVQVVEQEPAPRSFEPPPSEAELEKRREARVKTRRQHECERLCAEFHRAQALSHRHCMQNCVQKLFDAPTASSEPGESAEGGCADLLDPTACDYVSGRRPAVPGSGPARAPAVSPPASAAGP